ncbi:MAG: GDCCVxC domain-containing (seleno)protein [Gemmatimonadales bacterium]
MSCPHCEHRSLEDMPTESCQIVYDCRGCGARLVARAGDCCVFCSYGDVPCPSIRKGTC